MSNRTPAIAAAFVVCATSAAVVFAQQPTDGSALTRSRNLPEYTASGELMLPKNFHEWIYVGSPLTPNALNGGQANFPEYHNVYIEPGSYEIYQKSHAFPEGTIMFKELQLVQPAQNPDGSRTEPSGRGYFPGGFNGADVTVKDSQRFAASGGWGFFNFHHSEPKAATATVKPKEECAFCHIASAKRTKFGRSSIACWTINLPGSAQLSWRSPPRLRPWFRLRHRAGLRDPRPDRLFRTVRLHRDRHGMQPRRPALLRSKRLQGSRILEISS
jgi:hypothetical protein